VVNEERRKAGKADEPGAIPAFLLSSFKPIPAEPAFRRAVGFCANPCARWLAARRVQDKKVTLSSNR